MHPGQADSMCWKRLGFLCIPKLLARVDHFFSQLKKNSVRMTNWSCMWSFAVPCNTYSNVFLLRRWASVFPLWASVFPLCTAFGVAFELISKLTFSNTDVF